MVVSAVARKGPGGHASQVVALRRSLAVIGAQLRKSPQGNQDEKPFIREGILQKGTTTGYVEYYAARGACGDAKPNFGVCT
jgi:hypothetical protein